MVAPVRRVLAALTLATSLALVAACAPAERTTAAGTVAPVAADPTTTPTPPAGTPTPHLVAWHAPVEAIFVHPLVLDPQLAFRPDPLGKGFEDFFVTAREFGVLLDQLWRNRWTLVDLHDVAAGTVRVPRGRKPLVLIEDDANYYRYFEGRGLARRLTLDPEGRIRAQLDDGRLTDQDVVPMVDAEVAAHPEFSADGAKGLLAETAFEGLLGERDAATAAGRARLAPLVAALKADGWTFASHTYGHIDLTTTSPAAIREDLAKWHAIADPVLGPVDVLVYPFGAPPSTSMTEELARDGFPLQMDIDIRATLRHVGPATIISRRHVDGLAFDVPSRQAPFYSVAAVRDPLRPGD
ncbi:MAG TPA: polysaccharide deacetylase family protein [Nocardioides sp.]|nr:polysaccharide deacetylase family protein [Nocardioides sp.]